MFSYTALSVAVMALSAAPLVCEAAQAPTLAERVAASGGKPVTIGMMPKIAPLSLGELSRQADVIVEAKLIRVRSYLSADETTVLTDYQVVPSRVFHSRIADSSRPGVQPPLILTVAGGHVTIDGVPVTVTNSKARPIKDGGTFLVFARRASPKENRFQPLGESAGMFEIINGQRAEPMFKQLDRNPEVDGVPFDEIVKRIQAASPRR